MTDQTDEEGSSFEQTSKRVETSSSIWPRTQGTRDDVMKSLIESLSAKNPIFEGNPFTGAIEHEIFTAIGGSEEDSSIEQTTKTSSFGIWPPTQPTRDAVIKRLIETLTDKSVLSDQHGLIPTIEADVIARQCEEEAFTAAGGSSAPAGGDGGIEIMQVYSKEISKRMLEHAKARSASVPSSVERK